VLPGRPDKKYQQAEALWPDYAEAHNNLAILLQVEGDADGAETHHEEALRLRPNDPETHYSYALLLRARREQQRADEHFLTAYEIAPDIEQFRSAIEPPA